MGRGLEVAHRGRRRRRHRRGQGGGEDEAGRVGAHRVHHRPRAGDVAADHAERLAQRALDHIDPVHDPVALGDAGAARAIHADRVHLVEIGHGAVALGEIADGAYGGDIAIHGIDALEHDELRPVAGGAQQFFEMGEVVMPEHHLVAPGLTHALYHRIVVERVGEDEAIRDQLRQRGDAGLVRHVARGEDEAGLLAVQIGELGFKLHDGMAVAGNVAGAARARAGLPGGGAHRFDHVLMAAHAEIVVGAPDDDVALAFRRVPDGVRETRGVAFDFGEGAVATLILERVDGILEEAGVVHGASQTGRRRRTSEALCRHHELWSGSDQPGKARTRRSGAPIGKSRRSRLREGAHLRQGERQGRRTVEIDEAQRAPA